MSACPAFVRAFAAGAIALALPASAALLGPSDPAKPTIRKTMENIGTMSEELRLVEKRLEALESSVAGLDKSVAGIDKSVASLDATLKPAAELLKPGGIQALAKGVGEMAFEQVRGLILLATGCAAGLIVLGFGLQVARQKLALGKP